MKDQYNNEIPKDLCLLTWELVPNELLGKNHTLKQIDFLDWYCFEGNKTGHIFVEQKELERILGGPIDGTLPEDCAEYNLVKIDSVLHRWTEEDGFYHA